MKVLYVEDDRAYGQVLIDMFARIAPVIEMDWVESLAGAMSRLESLSPENLTYDVILTDMQLPDGNGIALLPYLAERGIRLPVVILTGAGSEDAVISALKSGASDYVVKRGDCFVRLSVVLEAACRRHEEEIARLAQHLRVLYVEPDTRDADLTKWHFANSAPFIQLYVVESGREALKRMGPREERKGEERDEYDVILTDYRLPDMSGLELMKELRENCGFENPVVLVTSQGDEESALLALRMGASDYVVKSKGYLKRLGLVIENAYNKIKAGREHAALKIAE